MKGPVVKKRYLFVAVVLLAAGLVFTGCDLLEPEDDTNDNTSSGTGIPWTINGTAESKSVIIEFTSKTKGKPEKDDKYKIVYDYNYSNPVSSGNIDVNGSATTPIITFIPTTGGDQFKATLDAAKLTFPNGILTPTGTIMGYRSDGSGDPISLVFDKDLDNTKPITITSIAGGALILTVAAKNNGNGGGDPYYQWYSTKNISTDGTAIVGARGPSYTVPTTPAGTVYYYARAGNPSGGVITSKKQEVNVITTEIVVGNGSGQTPLHNVRGEINKLIDTTKNPNIAYTLNFAVNLAYPLFIDEFDFPGGYLTIKSSVPFSKGIYIKRSNVELNGLEIIINDINNAALYMDKTPCAVLISNRYYLAGVVEADVKTYDKYKSYFDSAIRSVSIVDCRIVFNATSNDEDIVGIYVDPSTAGRIPDTRIRITRTIVDVKSSGTKSALCFSGNNTVFNRNIFTSSGLVAYIPFLFMLNYGENSNPSFQSENITFANNSFNSSIDTVFKIDVNTMAGVPDKEQEMISAVCWTFGQSSHKFGELPLKYRSFIENLFFQLTSPSNRVISLTDKIQGATASGRSESVEYIMRTVDNITPRPPTTP
jgi:hypothetical protein